MKDWKPISVDDTPITETTFKTQGWEFHTQEEDGESYGYWSLPLPKDNPDGESICMISSADDDWEELGLPEGQYITTLFDYNGLGECYTEEQIEVLYKSLTGKDIYEDED